MYYFVVESPRNEGKDFFEINMQTGEVFTKIMFDREKQGAYALEVEARDGAASARPNSNGQPNSGEYEPACFLYTWKYYHLIMAYLNLIVLLYGFHSVISHE